MRGMLRRWAGPGAVTAAALLLVGCNHFMKPRDGCGPDGCPAGSECLDHAKVCKNPTLMALGHDLDHLEKHVDWFGSAVAKVPDVWGQARLTEYREQFDRLMDPEAQGNEFVLGLQGSLARSDQAFFAQATALSFAAQPKPPVIGRVESTKGDAPDLIRTKQTIKETTTDSQTGVQTITDTTLEPPKPLPAPTPVEPVFKPIAAADPKGLLSEPDKAIERGIVADRRGFGGNFKNVTIGIEPTLMVAQKKRYLDFLAQLRRENEGDDTADSPGYSLNLVRIPVSVLPGKKTDEGHGAEVTMTLTPVLGDELLPMTYRNLVANDLLHQLGFPLTQFLNDREKAKVLTPTAKEVIIGLPVFNSLNELRRSHTSQDVITQFMKKLPQKELDRLNHIADLLDADDRAELKKLVATARNDRSDFGKKLTLEAPTTVATDLSTNPRYLSEPPQEEFTKAARAYMMGPSTRPTNAPDKPAATVQKVAEAFTLNLSIPSVSFSPGLENKTGFPTSQLLDVYGLSDCFQIAFAANTALQESITRQNYAHLPDVQGFLQQEIIAAYRFLAEPQCAHLWQCFCTPEMVSAVRTRKIDWLQDRRTEYRKLVKDITQGDPNSREQRPYNEPGEYSTTAALAWCILVDSALLTDKLIRDMKEVASSKGKGLAGCDQWCPYHLPCPPPECRQAFNAYVALRWPVRVFALDPYTEDQNVADALSTRRETQLALAIAFTNGFIGANTLTKFTRRLEAEYEAIALNRTQVGFGHGENTFGWRFYPRFQTPDTESNLTVFARDQLFGGPSRNALLRQRRLEPGPRECVAVVMMPSFVPYMTVDTVTNWFALANPKHKTLDHTQALKMSKTVQTLKACGCGVTDAECYRDGEFQRMLRRVEQLEARLPTQTMTVPVPVLNTLGGFEMFSNGTTDLAPELYGWYGAPGVWAGKDETTHLFLVGDHFSPLHTRVAIGNRPADRRMLSRQVMQVSVTGPLQTITDPETKRVYAQAHVATPYGVTRELLIPVFEAKPAAAAAEGYTVSPESLTLPYCKSGAKDGKYYLGLEEDFPSSAKVTVAWADALGTAPKKVTLTFGFTYKDCPFAVELADVMADNGTYTVDAARLKKDLVRDLFARLNQFGPFTEETNPLAAGVKVTGVTVKPDEGRAAKATPAGGSMVLKFECRVCGDKADVPQLKHDKGPVKPKAGDKPAGPADWPNVPLPLPLPTPQPLPPK